MRIDSQVGVWKNQRQAIDKMKPTMFKGKGKAALMGAGALGAGALAYNYFKGK